MWHTHDGHGAPADAQFPRCLLMSSQFFNRLEECGYDGTWKQGVWLPGVQRWFKKYKLEDYDMIMVPVNISQHHWTLAAVNLKDQRLEYFDSQQASDGGRLRLLHNWLMKELGRHPRLQRLASAARDWQRVAYTGTPKQLDGSSCAIFMVQTILRLALGAQLDHAQDHMPSRGDTRCNEPSRG